MLHEYRLAEDRDDYAGAGGVEHALVGAFKADFDWTAVDERKRKAVVERAVA